MEFIDFLILNKTKILTFLIFNKKINFLIVFKTLCTLFQNKH